MAYMAPSSDYYKNYEKLSDGEIKAVINYLEGYLHSEELMQEEATFKASGIDNSMGPSYTVSRKIVALNELLEIRANKKSTPLEYGLNEMLEEATISMKEDSESKQI